MIRPHQLLHLLVTLEDDDASSWKLRSGHDLFGAAADDGLVTLAAPNDLDAVAKALDELVRDGLVRISDPLGEYRSPHAPFEGVDLTNARDISVTSQGRALHAQMSGRPAFAGAASAALLSTTTEVPPGREVDFFVSYTSPDRRWAEWIAWQLEEAGYSVAIQVWDFVPGRNFVHEMQEATRRAKQTIAVLTPAYLAAPMPTAEWEAALRQDPTGVKRKLIPVRVEECRPEGLLASVVWIDLVGLDEASAGKRLLDGISGRAKPSEPPAFPGHAFSAPSFPGPDDRTPPVQHAVAPDDRAEVPSTAAAGVPLRLHGIFVIAISVEEAAGRLTIRLDADRELVRRLDNLHARGYGRLRVRVAYADRVIDGDLTTIGRATEGERTRLEIELERVESPQPSAMRAGTSGLSADDLVEVGLRHRLFGESLPDSLGLLKDMADPNIDLNAFRLALGSEWPEDAVRLYLLETLVGAGNAATISHLEIGRPNAHGERRLVLEWDEPRVYTNVEPGRRRIEGLLRP